MRCVPYFVYRSRVALFVFRSNTEKPSEELIVIADAESARGLGARGSGKSSEWRDNCKTQKERFG